MTKVQHQVCRSWHQYTIMHLNRRAASTRSDGICNIYDVSFIKHMERNRK